MSFLSRLRTSSRPVTTFPDMTEPRLFPSQERRCPDFPFIPVTGAVTEDCAIEIRAERGKGLRPEGRAPQGLAPAVQRALAEAKEHHLHRGKIRAEGKIDERAVFYCSAAEREQKPFPVRVSFKLVAIYPFVGEATSCEKNCNSNSSRSYFSNDTVLCVVC